MTSFKLFTITVFLAITNFLAHAQTNIRAADAEFFIEIPQRGRFTVSLGDETISNANGRFRFFNVPHNRLPLLIEAGNRVILKSEVFVKPGMRSIAVFNRNRVDVLKDIPLENTFLNNWDKCVEDKNNPNYPVHSNYRRLPTIYPMSRESFDKFIQSINRTAFDKDKLSLIEVGSANASFTVNQVLSIINQFSFSDGKISAVKKLYPSVIDSENGFQLMDAFTFSSEKDKVKRVILAGNYNYQQNGR